MSPSPTGPGGSTRSVTHDLVRCIRQFGDAGHHRDARGFGVGDAGFPEGHPAAPNRLVEMDHLKAKVDAGADHICTQLFFDNRDFCDFRDRCNLAGIRVPVVARIMPITSESNLRRIADLAAGARIPAGLLRAVARAQDSTAGIHFYTLNQSDATLRVYDHLGVSDSRAFH